MFRVKGVCFGGVGVCFGCFLCLVFGFGGVFGFLLCVIWYCFDTGLHLDSLNEI